MQLSDLLQFNDTMEHVRSQAVEEQNRKTLALESSERGLPPYRIARDGRKARI